MKKKVLQNGLTVFTLQIPKATSVLFTILVKVGSRYETKNINGVSHFLEHVFFKGSKKFPGPSDLTGAIDAIGGDFNASTSKELTEFYIHAEKHHFEFIFDALSDMILHPLFPAKEIKKEKGVVVEEINLYQDNPGVQVESNLEKIMWPDSPLGWEIVGTKQTVEALTRVQIEKYRSAHYVPENIILGISGAFDEKLVQKKVSELWSKLGARKSPSFLPVKEKQDKPRVEIEFRKTNQAHLALGFKSYEHGSKKDAAAYLLANLLGGSMSSRLFIIIREQKGLAYSVSAANLAYYNTGNFTVHAGLRIDQTLPALREILFELRKVRDNGVTDKELKRTRDYVKGKIALAMEDQHKRLEWVMEHYAYTGNVREFKDFIKEIEAVTAEDIQTVAKEIFVNSNLSLTVIGPFKNKKEFEKELYFK